MRHEPDQLDHALSPILPAVFGSVATVDAAWAAIDLITLTGQQRVAASATAGALTLVLALIGLLVRRSRTRARWARPLGAFAVLSVGLHGAAVLAITGSPVYTAWPVLAVVGAGAVILGLSWYVVTVGLVWSGWAAASYVAATTSSGHIDGWVYPQLALALVGATALSALLRSLRVRALADLDQALDRARDAEVKDPLTGVANVAGLNLLGSQVMEAARRHGDAVHCLVLDVDGLGVVNDRLGHLIGDEVLVGVADALVSAMRSGDVVARWGGDEFVVIGAGSGPSALEVERRVRAGLVESPPASPTVWPGRVSAGRAVKEPWDDDTLDSLLQKADREMLLRPGPAAGSRHLAVPAVRRRQERAASRAAPSAGSRAAVLVSEG